MADIRVQGYSCLHGRCTTHGATVCTYSIDVGDGTEVRAVYVFRPGYETARAEVEAALEGQAERLDGR